MKPLEILATSMAYLITVDGNTSVEEKAKLVALMGKHVSRGEIRSLDLKVLTRVAFDNVARVPLDTFLKTVSGVITEGQKICLMLNLYDVAATDGSLADGEKQVILMFENALGLDSHAVRQARKVILIKNDTAVFSNFLHAGNEPGYRFSLMDV